MHDITFLKTVIDEADRCSYLPEQTARMPLSLPHNRVSPEQLDELLAAGYRRSGWFFYHTQCPNCTACEPLRLSVAQFQPTRSQRRVLRRGDCQLRVKLQKPSLDARRLSLFNAHRHSRALSHGESAADAADYQAFLINAHCDVVELSLWLDDLLIAVSITDVGARSLSAVYCYFDPLYASFSPGTYAILRQIELARSTEREWIYLGMYVAANRHLNYKAKFAPHQRWVGGKWVAFP